MYCKSLLILSAVLLIFGCADNNDTPANTIDSTTVTEKPVADIKETSTGVEKEPEEELIPYDPSIPEKGQYCFIKNFFTEKDTGFIEADYIQFLIGDEALEAAQNRKDENPILDDIYIINDNPRLRTLKLAPEAEFWALYIQGDIYRKKSMLKELASQDEFAIFILTFNEKGEVVKIKGQYLP